ncbi:hypothetical protein PM082_020952 [Marasmius tenuissimus]|nr:hypothetical protein PM082_020952 [Marasmius tenuissimus]
MSPQNYNFFSNSDLNNNNTENNQHTQNPGSRDNSANKENQPVTNALPPAAVNSTTPRQHFQFGSLTEHDLPRGYFPPPGLPPLRQQGFYYEDPRQRHLEHDPSTRALTPSGPARPRPQPTRLPPPNPPAPSFASLPAPRSLTPDNVLERQLPPTVVPPQLTQPSTVRRNTRESDVKDAQPPVAKKRKKVVVKSAKPTQRPTEKVDEEVRKGRGRTKEASAYSNDEMRKVVEFYEDVIPIGRRGWEEVLRLYNEWAQTNGYPERQLRPLQMKWNNMVRTATEHPTGDGERLQIYEDVLRAEAAANERVACGDLQDDSDQEDEDDVIDISSGDDEEPSAKVKKEKKKGKEKQDEKKGTVVTKAYRTEPPLPSRDTTSTSRTSRARQASAALQSIAAASDPERQQQLLDQRTQRTLQLFQFQHLQSQVTSLTQQVSDLTSRLHQEQMRTMASENQLQTMRLMLRFQGQGPGSPFGSPRSHHTPRRARSQYDYRRRRSRYDRSPSPDYRRSSRQRDRSRSPVLPLRTPSPPPPVHSPSLPVHSPPPPVHSPALPASTSIASGSRVTLEVLADAAEHLEDGHEYSIHPHPDGHFDIH